MADGAAAPEPPSSLPPSASLYVGDLDPAVGEDDLFCAFAVCGHVASVRVCRDCRTGASLRYAYVNFLCRSHAENALRALNHSALRGRPMRIMWSQRNPCSRKSGMANLFVKNLDESVDGAQLEEMFGKYGTVLSCKVATQEDGQSKGFGFVQFEGEESAQAAIKALDGAAGHGNKRLYVGKFVRKSERQPPDVPVFSNLYIKNLDNIITDDFLLKKFSGFGKVRNAFVMKDELGRSKGFGFVSFESPEDAQKAIEAMNGALLGSKAAYVSKALRRTERYKLQREQSKGFSNSLQKMNKSKVYVKNLHASIDDKGLREIFIGCGRIISAKVIRNVNGGSRGFGFVCFSSPVEAERARLTLNGTMVLGGRLFVAISQSKEVRQRAFQSLPANMQPAVTSRPQNRPLLIYPQQVPTKQQYGLAGSLRNHPGELPAFPMLRYQQSQVMYGNASWLTAFPYYAENNQHCPFVSQWFQPMQAMKNALWMQGNYYRIPFRAPECYVPEMNMTEALRGFT